MAIWRSKKKVPTTGPQIHVMWEVLGGMDQHVDTATNVVSKARLYMTTVSTALGNGYNSLTEGEQGWLDKFFILKGSPPSTQAFTDIQNVITLTNNGLSNSFNLKISNNTSQNGQLTVGYVRSYNQNTLPAFVKSDWQQKPNQGRYSGNIHVHQSVLTTKYGVKTLIHEATHRYAGTSDFGERGYTDDTSSALNFRQAGLLDSEALNNAESYAAFIYMFCALERGI